jgi:hypothetical protein
MYLAHLIMQIQLARSPLQLLVIQTLKLANEVLMLSMSTLALSYKLAQLD